ncbi:DUF2624 family protein [Salicibibacter cibarius]|uniref:DUF2624 family protein n=1 Tax=Salicibibacter cibarius TaxID=2743000 RepID=A0A7T6Z332_9BACI|nr:DUF2624 family protein [Salicibibacter cibarius]QQK75861.1 DUF2624 family protein [Salicibibacter cibarius]
MNFQMIQQYVKNMSPQQLQALAHSKGYFLTDHEVQKLVHLIQTEHVDFADQASVFAFINKVEKTTSQEHAMLLHDLYQKYGGFLRQ